MVILKKIAGIILRISISFVLLIFLFKRVDARSLLEIIKKADLSLLFLGFSLTSFVYVLCFFRWRMLLNAVGIKPAAAKLIPPFAAGIFFNLLLPSSLGGDLVRSMDLSVHTKKAKEVVASVILDRLSGAVGLAIIALLAILFGWQIIQDKIVILYLSMILAVLAVIITVIFNEFLYSKINSLLHSPRSGKIRAFLESLHQEIYIFRKNKKTLENSLILSSLIQVISPLATWIVALALGLRINPVYFFVFLPIIFTITLLPISLGGIGLREASTVYFFSKIGVGNDVALAMSVLSFSFTVAYAAVGGIVYVFTLHHRRI
jgi:hypothetical protein